DQAFGYDNAGEVYIQRAWFRRACGEDPGDSVANAVELLHTAIKRIPKNTTFLANLAMTHAIQADYDLGHGRDPSSSLKARRDAIDKAVASNPKDAQAQVVLAELGGLEARLQARDGRGSPEAFAAVAKQFASAIAIAPDDLDYGLAFGQFCRSWAMFL